MDPREGVDIVVEASGIGAEAPITFGQMFQNTVKRYPDQIALRYKQDGTWTDISYTEYYNRCIRAAKSFLKVLLVIHCVGESSLCENCWV